jgi:hypothetical protein
MTPRHCECGCASIRCNLMAGAQLFLPAAYIMDWKWKSSIC